jgi:hypothetical protein
MGTCPAGSIPAFPTGTSPVTRRPVARRWRPEGASCYASRPTVDVRQAGTPRRSRQRTSAAPGMLRRFERAISSIRPTPPVNTTLVAASAKPLTCAALTCGGIDSLRLRPRARARLANSSETAPQVGGRPGSLAPAGEVSTFARSRVGCARAGKRVHVRVPDKAAYHRQPHGRADGRAVREPVFPCCLRHPLQNQGVAAQRPSDHRRGWKFGPSFRAAADTPTRRLQTLAA